MGMSKALQSVFVLSKQDPMPSDAYVLARDELQWLEDGEDEMYEMLLETIYRKLYITAPDF